MNAGLRSKQLELLESPFVAVLQLQNRHAISSVQGSSSTSLACLMESAARLLHCTKCHVGQPNPDDTEEKWFKTSLKALRVKFSKELVFVILTPSFKTLRQQTFDRLLKAGLADAGKEHLVVPCIWAGKVRQGAGSHCSLWLPWAPLQQNSLCLCHACRGTSVSSMSLHVKILSGCTSWWWTSVIMLLPLGRHMMPL